MGIKFENGKVTKTPDRTYQPIVFCPNQWANNIEQMEEIFLPERTSAAEAKEEICQFLNSLTDIKSEHCSPVIVRSDGKKKFLWGKNHPAYCQETIN